MKFKINLFSKLGNSHDERRLLEDALRPIGEFDLQVSGAIAQFTLTLKEGQNEAALRRAIGELKLASLSLATLENDHA